jgi:hypothetical protein
VPGIKEMRILNKKIMLFSSRLSICKDKRLKNNNIIYLDTI